MRQKTEINLKTKRQHNLWIPVLPIWIASLILLGILILYPSVNFAANLRGYSVIVFTLLIFSSVCGAFTFYFLFRDLFVSDELIKRASQLEAVHKIIQKAGRSLELKETLDTITQVTVEVTGLRGCSIKLFDPETGTMRVRSIAGLKRELTDLSVDVAENIYHKGLVDGKPVFVEDALKKDFPELDDEMESLICVPLTMDKKPLGALCLYGEKGEHLSSDMIDFLASLGELVTLSIANATVFENLKKLDQAKTWFLLKASHELKSPLSAIRSISKTLSDEYIGKLNDKQKEMLNRIDHRAGALAEIVNDLITLVKGRAEISFSEREKINLCETMADSVEFYSAKAKDKGIVMKIICTTHESIIYGRREGLESIITNLLSNAIKYTNRGGEVTLKMSAEGDKVFIEVSDTGIGIPEEEQQKMFHEFFRASNAKELTEDGTGLGLAIVKTNVDRHGGKIEFKSTEGKGTTFKITLKRLGN